MQLGAMKACTKRITEATRGIGQKGVKGVMKDIFLFESWFSSNNLAEFAINVAADMIGIAKTNTQVFCKETIQKLTNY